MKINVGLFLVFLSDSRRLWVATMFCWKCMSGLVEPILTSGFAAKWNTRSKCSSSSFLRSAGFRRSPFMNVMFGLLCHCSMFCKVPALRLSKT